MKSLRAEILVMTLIAAFLIIGFASYTRPYWGSLPIEVDSGVDPGDRAPLLEFLEMEGYLENTLSWADLGRDIKRDPNLRWYRKVLIRPAGPNDWYEVYTPSVLLRIECKKGLSPQVVEEFGRLK